jgi:serine phosphatase RsbU (regulator of sigma subunit)
MITLQIVPLVGTPREEPLRGGPVRIGRSPDNDIAISDPSVSREHARLDQTPSGYVIHDLGSRNGVVVNGRRIERPTPVTLSDEIQLGDVTLKLIDGPEVTLTESTFEGPVDTTFIAYDPESGLDGSTLGAAVDQERPRADTLLKFFQEVTNAVIAARPFDEVVEEIVRQLLTMLPEADRACLLLLEGDPPEPRPRVARHRSGRAVRMTVSRTIVRRVVETLDSVLSANAQEDSRFVGTQSLVIQGTCAVMCVPLAIGRQAIGVLYVDTLSPFKHFDTDQLRLFTTLGNIAAGHIQRQGLLEEKIASEAQQRELAQAAEIQRRLLAVPPVTRPGYSFHAANRPCLSVGGDYFDMIDLGENGVVFAIADVCGKGTGAALLMSALQATVRAQSSVGGSPLIIGKRVNDALYASTDTDKFVTLFLAHLDPESGRLTFVNAGHDAPLLFRADSGQPEELAATGLISGILPDAPLTEATVDLRPGDLLFAYTDGIREALSPAEEEFGAERLIATVAARRDLELAELVHTIESEVRAFVAGSDPQDDITQLVIRRERSTPPSSE